VTLPGIASPASCANHTATLCRSMCSPDGRQDFV